ncbi:VOC family protein [Amycolatopsis nigrescens]|uniref:VOC family protein n=1 Tax=Amycolatopsis nigrescens TaxID=381445 RepID=UPI0003999A04|nr:VOC family protein [Amycolatopsis nigrescens]
MALPVTGVNEIVLEVQDLAAAERFYTEVLDLPVLMRWQGDLWRGREGVWILAGDTRIGLWTPQIGISRGRGGVHVHYAMRVEEKDYDDVVRGISERGGKVDEVIFGEDRETPAKAAYVHDPDGHVVEFWTWDAPKGDTGPPTPVTENVHGL